MSEKNELQKAQEFINYIKDRYPEQMEVSKTLGDTYLFEKKQDGVEESRERIVVTRLGAYTLKRDDGKIFETNISSNISLLIACNVALLKIHSGVENNTEATILGYYDFRAIDENTVIDILESRKE